MGNSLPVSKRVNFLQELDVPESLPVVCPSDLLERRPVRAAEQQLKARTCQSESCLYQYVPRLALTGQFGWKVMCCPLSGIPPIPY